jgi:hypothetical protein
MIALMCLVLITNAANGASYADAALMWRRCEVSHRDIERYGPTAFAQFEEFVLTVGTAATK